jgi:hypothetical protein
MIINKEWAVNAVRSHVKDVFEFINEGEEETVELLKEKLQFDQHEDGMIIS